MRTLLNSVAVTAVLAFAAQARADVTVCTWGTITGPDALVNGMTYGTRDYLEFLNQTKGGIAGQKVRTL
jgi:branched-chain amino acid transport system substrate-binding protein